MTMLSHITSHETHHCRCGDLSRSTARVESSLRRSSSTHRGLTMKTPARSAEKGDRHAGGKKTTAVSQGGSGPPQARAYCDMNYAKFTKSLAESGWGGVDMPPSS